jgi:hypothetical protein
MKETEEERQKRMTFWAESAYQSNLLWSFDRKRWDGHFSPEAKKGINQESFERAQMSNASIEDFAKACWCLGGPGGGDPEFFSQYKAEFGMTYPELLEVSNCPQHSYPSEGPRNFGREYLAQQVQEDAQKFRKKQETTAVDKGNKLPTSGRYQLTPGRWCPPPELFSFSRELRTHTMTCPCY